MRQPTLLMEGLKQAGAADSAEVVPPKGGSDQNRMFPQDRAAHDWYRFVLSFPPHLVREYIDRFSLTSRQCVLDPFCGTGTTLVEAKKLGIRSVGIEANPMARFASEVKVDWSPDPDGLSRDASSVAERADENLAVTHISDEPADSLFTSGDARLGTLSEEQFKLLLTNSISPLPLHKALVLLEAIRERCGDRQFQKHELIAFAKAVVQSASNLNFGPEVGVGKPREDAAVVGPLPLIPPWLRPRCPILIGKWDSRVVTGHSFLEILTIGSLHTRPNPSERNPKSHS